jgi:hypothetical protein
MITLAWVLVVALGGPLAAQDPTAPQPSTDPQLAEPADVDRSSIRVVEQQAVPPSQNLADQQRGVAQQFERLELLAGRLAELSRSSQPGRASVLRKLVAKSNQQQLQERFAEVVLALGDESFSRAREGQTALEQELQQLLELLLQEDRNRQLESDRKRLARYLLDLKRIIRLQRGITARTDGGDTPAELADDQQRAAEKTADLEQEISKSEGLGRTGENSGEAQQGEGQQGEAQQGEAQPGEGQQGEGQQGEGQQGEGQQGQAQQGEGQQREPGEPSQEAPPMERAAQRLQRAQQRMEQARKKLEKAESEGAVERQREAVAELEQAEAELERILRQLREEELERSLVLLEARFRKMLEMQVEIYEETQRLDDASDTAPQHEVEIVAARLSRQERQIVRDAERALVLLREDGTSAAFPEAVEQARDDMTAIAERLAQVRIGLITQGLEEDVIQALEETLATLRKALQELRDQRSRNQQGSGQPGEQPLVSKLAELRMIRALQVRVNRRTQRYGELLVTLPQQEEELRPALKELADRQERIFEATRDLHLERNQ